MTIDTAKLRSLRAAGTPGRWSWDKVAREIRNEHGEDVVSAYPTHGVEPGDNGASIDIKYTDLELIIEAVNSIEALLDEIDRLRAQVPRRRTRVNCNVCGKAIEGGHERDSTDWCDFGGDHTEDERTTDDG